MRRSVLACSIACLAFSAPGTAAAQSVSINVGNDGQLHGQATAGDVSSSVTAGDGRVVSSPRYAPDPHCGPGRSRTTTVTSPDGSSSSSVSVSGNGVVSTGGAGSPGSVVNSRGCDEGRSTFVRPTTGALTGERHRAVDGGTRPLALAPGNASQDEGGLARSGQRRPSHAVRHRHRTSHHATHRRHRS